jgi:hypothetical protein
MTFEVTLRDRSVDTVDDADAYQQEGQMTTFFQHGAGRQVLDTWATRVASYRTNEVLTVKRISPAERSALRSA